MLDTSARLLRLLSLLQSRPEWTGPELAERLEVTVRTLRRDIARLRELGYPVQATVGVAGRYRLGAGSTLPPLLLDDDEAVAIVLSLRTATSHTATGIAETSLRALAKLERILPVRLSRRTAALREATIALTSQAPTANPEVLTLLAEACQAHHLLTFGYLARGGEASSRRVEPHRLVHTGRRWYLVARDQDRDDWRTFRVDRIDDPRTTGIRFVPRDPPDAAAYVADAVTAAPYRYRARILVRAPAATVAERISPGTGIVEAADLDSCLLTLGGDSLPEIAMHLALLGHDFVVHEPAELAEELGRLADRLGRAHRASTR
ncbi:helix-turn-helix transcriptional regulator [Streptomyces hayashii]|uniref:helix-turn-helix transcriptional regulator n=1 Tax=Streptomyces hayashii TaxID=2839966 RepID=UPI00403CA67A